MSIGLEGLGVVDTIYEDQEEFCRSSTEIDIASNSGWLDNPADRAWIVFENSEYTPPPTTTRTPQESLHAIVWTWCQATGFPTSVTVHVGGRRFELHKFPLVSNSGYFKRELMESTEIRLSCPGGAETFELVAAHCYGSAVPMGPPNVASLRCAAEVLEMTEEYSKGNLCKRAELYLKDVALKSWDDALRVLRSCEALQPFAGDLLIDRACLEAAASAACSSGAAVSPVEFGFGGGHMEEEEEEEDSRRDWMINDLLTLPLDYFVRMVESMRARGMPEKFLGRAIVLYVDTWVFDMTDGEISKARKKFVVESVVKLLPADKGSIPVGFLFALLRCAFAWNASRECRSALETRIAGQVDQATVTDFLLPLKDRSEEDGEAVSAVDLSEVESMQQIVSLFMSQQTDFGDESDHTFFSEGNTSSHSSCSNPCVCNVAKLWDEYLTEIAVCSKLSAEKFLDLVETVPSFSRSAHDQLYRAIHIFLKTHPETSESQRVNICKMLNCQKLSQEVCIHAVQNDSMPLRTIVQAMYIHHLQSMVQIHDTSRSNSLRIQNLVPSSSIHSNTNNHGSRSSNSLGLILKRDAAFRHAADLRSELEETNTRLKYLEEEIKYMRKNFQGGTDQPDSSKQAMNSSDPEDCSKQAANSLSSSNIFLKKPSNLIANKGCGGGGMAQKFVKSLQKLSLTGLRTSKSKPKQSNAPDIISANIRATDRSASNSTEEPDLVTENDRPSRPRYTDNVNLVADAAKPERRRHRRGRSMS